MHYQKVIIETHIISPNPETTALYGEMHPSTPIVIL